MSAHSLVLEDAWLPHGRFRGEGHVPVRVTLSPGETSRIELRVTSAEEPGSVVNNAFLILRSSAGRVFARMRIEFPDTAPRPVIEAVTLQPLQSADDGAFG